MTTRVHIAARRRGGVAARGARAGLVGDDGENIIEHLAGVEDQLPVPAVAARRSQRRRRIVSTIATTLAAPEIATKSRSFCVAATRAFVRRLTSASSKQPSFAALQMGRLGQFGAVFAVIRATQGRVMVIAAAASRGVGNSPTQ